MGKPIISGVKFDGTVAEGGLVQRSGAKHLTEVEYISEALIIPRFAIDSFTDDAATQEVGATLNAWNFNWEYNLDPAIYVPPPVLPVGSNDPSVQTIKTIPGVAWVNPIVPTSLRTVASAGAGLNPAIATTYTYTLSATGQDGITDSATTSIYFRLKRYWGYSTTDIGGLANDPARATFILANLSSEFTTGRAGSKSYAIGGTPAYMYWVFPASYGPVPPAKSSTTFDGLPFSDFTATTIVNFTNASGHSEDYIMYQTTVQTGTKTWAVS